MRMNCLYWDRGTDRFIFCLVYCYWTAIDAGASTNPISSEIYSSLGLLNYLFTYVTSIPYSTNVFVYMVRIPSFRHEFTCGLSGRNHHSDLQTWDTNSSGSGRGKHGSKHHHHYNAPEFEIGWLWCSCSNGVTIDQIDMTNAIFWLNNWTYYFEKKRKRLNFSLLNRS